MRTVETVDDAGEDIEVISTCENCGFYDNGQCRRRAPVPLVMTRNNGYGDITEVETHHPVVGLTDWCGEWVFDAEKAPQPVQAPAPQHAKAPFQKEETLDEEAERLFREMDSQHYQTLRKIARMEFDSLPIESLIFLENNGLCERVEGIVMEQPTKLGNAVLNVIPF